MTMRISWNASLPDLYTATRIGTGRHREYLVAELLPDGGWEWMVWMAGSVGHCFRGEAPDRVSAMLAAERTTFELSAAAAMTRAAGCLLH